MVSEVELIKALTSDPVKDFAGWLTIFVSLKGIMIYTHHFYFLNSGHERTAFLMKYVFLSSAVLYIVSFIMAVGTTIDLVPDYVWRLDYIIRPLVMMFDVFASSILFLHFWMLKPDLTATQSRRGLWVWKNLPLLILTSSLSLGLLAWLFWYLSLS